MTFSEFTCLAEVSGSLLLWLIIWTVVVILLITTWRGRHELRENTELGLKWCAGCLLFFLLFGIYGNTTPSVSTAPCIRNSVDVVDAPQEAPQSTLTPANTK